MVGMSGLRVVVEVMEVNVTVMGDYGDGRL